MLTPPVHLKLFREQDKPETIDDFIAIYDLHVTFGLVKSYETCRVDSGCFFRNKLGCDFITRRNDPENSVTCDNVFGDEDRPAIFILRSEYESRQLSS